MLIKASQTSLINLTDILQLQTLKGLAIIEWIRFYSWKHNKQPCLVICFWRKNCITTVWFTNTQAHVTSPKLHFFTAGSKALIRGCFGWLMPLGKTNWDWDTSCLSLFSALMLDVHFFWTYLWREIFIRKFWVDRQLAIILVPM